MKRVFKVTSLLVTIALLFTFGQFKTTGASTVIPAAGTLPEGISDRLKDSIVLYVGSPNAFVNNAPARIDTANQEVTPVIRDSRTLVPVRFIAESLGAKVEWNEKTSTVAVTLEQKAAAMTLGSRTMTVGGRETTLDVAAESINGRTFIPLRALAEALGKKVFYDRGLIVISDFENIFDIASERNHIDGIIGQLNSLPVVATQEKLRSLLEDITSNKFDERVSFPATMEMAKGADTDSGSSQSPSAPAAADYGAAGKADYSQTNTQVQGVDEADVVKTDGEYIYQVNNQRIIVAKAYPADQMKVISIVKFSDPKFNPTEIYLYNNKMVVIGNSYVDSPGQPYQGNESAGKRVMPGYYPYSRMTTKAILFDISDKSAVKQTREVEVEGSYASSRRIGASLYMVANQYVNAYMLKEGSQMVTPTYRDTAVKNEAIPVGYEDIRYFPGVVESNYMILAGIDLDKDEQPANIQTYLGSGRNIYVSEQHLYVASSGHVNAGVRPMIGIAADVMPAYEFNTVLYKFSLNQGKATYIAKGEVPGNILNQFSMDENKGYFRIATTNDNVKINDTYTSTNNLFVLDDMLNITGKVENIAPGERIYSARFMGDRAYMVTFKTVDPLFVIDLKNPAKPAILGALKIPGYSNYLHPYDENHIIGFGKDTVELSRKDSQGREMGTMAYYLGMKIALFDVTDVSNPVEKFVEKIGDRGTDSLLLQNHRALLFDKSKNLLAFPVNVSEVKNKNLTDSYGFPQYGEPVFQGAYVYNIDLNKGFTLKGKITHLPQEEYLKSGNTMFYGDKSIERLLYIGETLYTLSKGMIKANDLTSLKETGTVTIP